MAATFYLKGDSWEFSHSSFDRLALGDACSATWRDGCPRRVAMGNGDWGWLIKKVWHENGVATLEVWPYSN